MRIHAEMVKKKYVIGPSKITGLDRPLTRSPERQGII